MRISGAQADRLLAGGHRLRPGQPMPSGRSSPKTIAKSLAIGNPADGWYALDVDPALGRVLRRGDRREIVEAIGLLARTEGIFAETAGGVTIATLGAGRSGVIRPEERASPCHGPRAQDGRGAGRRTGAGPSPTIPPTLEAFDAAVGHGPRDWPRRPSNHKETPP